MGKLHETLATESSLGSVSEKLTKESIKTMSKENLFTGEVKYHKVFDEEKQHLVQPPVVREVTTTVGDNLDYLFSEGLIPYWDAVIQKDEANQRSQADIEIDGTVIASGVPGTTLLGLESKLSKLMDLFNSIPTLAPGVRWEPDHTKGKGIFINGQVDERIQAIKVPDFKVLYEATKEHPAQIKEFETTVPTGKFEVTSYSGMISPLDKAALIKRLQKLISAVKKARQRANCVEVNNVRIGDSLAKYLLDEDQN